MASDSKSENRRHSSRSRVDHKLPSRLFATDRYPENRLNIYSRPDILGFIRHVLRDTPEFELIKVSPFGKLFDLPVRQCPVSCKLIHSLLSRQLLSNLKYIMWTAFGGNPLRYGLQEFGTVTGLPCGDFPDGYEPTDFDVEKKHLDPIWKKLIGNSKTTTIADLGKKLEKEPRMAGWKKIRLALIMIVDGVLIAHKQYPCPTLRYVQMVDDLDTFFNFPWGRESFLKTISCMRHPIGAASEETMVDLLSQDSYRLQGFPLTLQLVAFTAIPRLQDKIPAPVSQLTIMDLKQPHLPNHPSINIKQTKQVEAEPNLSVAPVIPIDWKTTQPGWGVWPDETTDEHVAYMEQLIGQQFHFDKRLWPGGDASRPLIKVPKDVKKPVKLKQTVPRSSKLQPKQSIIKQPANRKQSRLSSFFPKKTAPTYTNKELTEMLLQLQDKCSTMETESKELRKMIQKSNRPYNGNRYTLNKYQFPHKKPKIGDQLTPEQQCSKTPNNTPEHTQTREEVQERDHSPIVSQYAAQRFLFPDENETNPTMHDHTPSNHTTPDHNNIDHNSSDQIFYNHNLNHDQNNSNQPDHHPTTTKHRSQSPTNPDKLFYSSPQESPITSRTFSSLKSAVLAEVVLFCTVDS